MPVSSSRTGAELIQAARALGPRIRACADQIERDRRLPEALVDEMAAAELFKMTVPRELGGSEADPETYTRVIEEVARADGSAGWCVMIPATQAMAAGTVCDDVAREIWGDHHGAYMAGSAAGSGRADVVDGGFRVAGRWSFASGCQHATWLGAACQVYDHGESRLGPNGFPERRMFFLPAAACRVLDTWHVTGLRGSGSHDFEVDAAFVPSRRSIPNSYPTPPRHPGHLYAFGTGKVMVGAGGVPAFSPWVGLTPAGFSAVSLGIARGALDAFAELARSKELRGGRGLLGEDAVIHADFGRAEATLRAARALLYETVRDVWKSVCQTGEATSEQMQLIRLAGTHAAARAAEVVETVWKAAGASSIFIHNPLERRFRDVHVATQNVAVNAVQYRVAGRMFLGVEM